jgi:hypothetical protein
MNLNMLFVKEGLPKERMSWRNFVCMQHAGSQQYGLQRSAVRAGEIMFLSKETHDLSG